MESNLSSLGSLAQSARKKQLKSTRGILLFIGVLTVAVNGFMFVVHDIVDKAIKAEVQKLGPNFVVDPAKAAPIRASLIRLNQLIAGAGIALGVVFILFGVMVEKHPVPITITALTIYIAAAAIPYPARSETFSKVWKLWVMSAASSGR